eukprot:scaffold1389_cov251-Ochromonas_danica.AAC.1
MGSHHAILQLNIYSICSTQKRTATHTPVLLTLSIFHMLSRVIEVTEEEDFTVDHFLGNDNYSMIDFVELVSSDEMSPESSQMTSLQSDTLISSMRVGSEGQKMEKKSSKRKKTQEEPTARQLKRLEHRKRCQLTFNRMVKGDLRRVFPTMYCNVRNQNNAMLMQAFLGHYLRSDCEVIAYVYPTVGVSLSHLKGAQEYANFVGTLHAQHPDAVLLLLGSRIVRKFHEETSVVEIFINMKATRLTYPIVTSVGDEVIVGPKPAEVVDIEVKFKISFFMNKEGLIFKIVGSTIPSFPAFLTTPSTNTLV